MGATPTYGLPWPELTDSADGPKGFQNLATKTEEVITSATAGKLFIQNSPVGGINVTTNASGIVKVTFPIAFKAGSEPAVTVNTLSPNSGAYVINFEATIATGGVDNAKFGLKFYIAADGTVAKSRTIAIVWSAVGLAA